MQSKVVVLVVEDEPLLLMNAAEALEDLGFEVATAINADAAVSLLEARPDIHVVFSDVHMPGSMDGLKLAHYVRDRWPPIKIIATSGRADLSENDLPSGTRFVPKPYRLTSLGALIHEITARTG